MRFFALLAFFTIPLFASIERLPSLLHKDTHLKALRLEIKTNMKLSKMGRTIEIRWRSYRLREHDTFFTFIARTMQDHDTVSSVNRLSSMWDVRPGAVWLIPNMRGIATYGSLQSLRLKYPQFANLIVTVPQKKGLYFIPGAQFRSIERKYLNLQAFIRPVIGRTSSNYGRRIDPFSKKRAWHSGVDIACAKGSKVVAAAGGRVVFTGKLGGYGKTVIVEHQNGYRTLYGHLSGYKASKGTRVYQGQVVALSGSTGRATGPHLHFEVRRRGQTKAPRFH